MKHDLCQDLTCTWKRMRMIVLKNVSVFLAWEKK